MARLSGNVAGILLMLAATAAFTANDTLLKMATETIPPYEAVFLRSVIICIFGVPFLALSRYRSALPLMGEKRVLVRNIFELLAVYGFMMGLANTSIADLTAISQLSPMIVLVGAVFLFGERISRMQLWLVGVAFAGALLVAQPGGSGFTPFALFGFWNAMAVATRDLLGRRINGAVPGLIIAVGSGVVVLVGTGIATWLLEDWVMPDPSSAVAIFGASVLLVLGHWLILKSYRVAPMSVVVPFCYVATIWALLSSALVFGTVPNTLALCGIGLILISGVVVVAVERWPSREVVSP
jgi:drug/metabolite transporter (DMT)-like permease